MFYEKCVNSLSRLREEIGLLDLDSGIRTRGTYKGKESLIFITRSLHGYTLMTYTVRKRGKALMPVRRLFVREFKDREELEKFIKTVVSRPIRAFVY